MSERLRKRQKQEYKEYSSSGEGSSQDGVAVLPDSTSHFKNEHMEPLGFKFVNVETLSAFLPTPLLIQNCTDQELLAPGTIFPLSRAVTDLQISQNYPNSFNLVKSLQELVSLQNSENREWRTDTFVNKVLSCCGFDKYPFLIQIKPYLSGLIDNKELSSIPDHGILKNGANIIVNENKRDNITSATNNFGEAQLVGEMLIAAENMRVTRGSDRTVYGIRVLGTRFTFYRAIFSSDYIAKVATSYPVEGEVTIYRYPAEDYDVKNIDQINTFDYCEIEDRRLILNTLFSINNTLRQ